VLLEHGDFDPLVFDDSLQERLLFDKLCYKLILTGLGLFVLLLEAGSQKQKRKSV